MTSLSGSDNEGKASSQNTTLNALHQTYKTNIPDQLYGITDIDESQITTYEHFEQIYHVRHDIIHSLVCESRGYPFGEKKVSDIIKESGVSISDKTYLDQIKNQTPDFFKLTQSSAKILEISISKSRHMEKEKHSKYALLIYFLKRNGFQVDMEVLVINPDLIYQQRDTLIKVHKLSDPIIDLIKKVCDNSKALETAVRNTPMGSLFYLQHYKFLDQDSELGVSIQDVLDIDEFSSNKITHSDEDLIKLLKEDQSSHINDEDDSFLDHCVSKVLGIEPVLTQQESFDEEKFISKIDELSSNCDFENPRSIFPLPYIDAKFTDSSHRTTEDDQSLCIKIAAKMRNGQDPILSIIAKSFEEKYSEIRPLTEEERGMPFRCNLSTEQKAALALEGPGRKHYVKRPDQFPDHVESQKKYTNYSLPYNTDVHQLGGLSRILSETDVLPNRSDMISESYDLANLGGFGLDYVKICQSIYREININALRKDRRRNFLIRPTGVDGVYVLLCKGPKLRTGEVVSQIWFKVIIDNDHRRKDNLEPIWAFKRLYNSGSYSHSGWLSTDSHRLDHYLRCYDKIIMGYYTMLSLRYRTTYDQSAESQNNKTILESLKNDTTNILGLIIMIYMEDKRSTSKLLQNVRYLVMTSISVFPYYESVMKKCIEPVRSPLQLYILKKMVQYIARAKNVTWTKQYKYGSVGYDSDLKLFLDQMGGSQFSLPRPIVDDHYSIYADFTEILSEMYFTMLFNKNQDDPTHASFQILSKMLEGEESMQEMKVKGHHLGYIKGKSDKEWASEVIDNPHSHKFSKKAIEVGSKLVRQFCGDRMASDIKIAKSKPNMNKTLDEFATFKASANQDNDKYKPNLMQQNTKRRCLEGVMELLEEGLHDSKGVVKKYLSKDLAFQIFKKNQIGGVREILILPIINRIKINIIETLSRNICSFDKREVMTHGPEKNDLIKESLFEARKKPGKRMSLFFSMDKSKWGPSFVPSQFIYLFTPFKKQLGDMFYYIVSQLIIHQNKRCILPERLVRAWITDKANLLSHRKDERLQKLKTKFLQDNLLYFVNESNMGQGILHYTSSLLHSAMISFRDELYRRVCLKSSLDPDDHFDLFSSDDSFTVMSIEVHRMTIVLQKLNLFMKCQDLSERLFNCTTSKAKSSINPIIGEFNSLFMSNLTFYPTLFKFTLSSVHPVNTDSFFRMVKESYSSCRQIVENGGTMDLYLIAHQLNKIYAESIYHTNLGGVNDLNKIGVSKRPYQVGCYPIFNPSLMLMFGPEFHNYCLYKNFESLNDSEKKLFINSHKIVKGGLVETLAELEMGETMLGGILRIEAKIGPITYLENLKKRSLMTKNDLEKTLLENPLMMFKKPTNVEEVKFKTCQKLFIPGANEALKSICASIYYGRVSASVSANAFYIPNSGYELTTFFNCVEELINFEKPTINIEDHIKFLYPKWPEYELFVNEQFSPIADKERNVFEIQTTRNLAIFKVGTRITNSIIDILEYLWMGKDVPEHEENRYIRDVEILKAFYPLLKGSLEETMSQFTGEKKDQMKAIIMLIIKLYSLRDRSIKAIVFGDSTSDVRETYYNLVEKNTTVGLTHGISIIPSTVSLARQSYNLFYIMHNHYILNELSGRSISDSETRGLWDCFNIDFINMMMMDHKIGKNIKKRIFMILMQQQKLDNLELWSYKTSVPLHYWEQRQKFNKSNMTYEGNGELTIFMGRNKLRVFYHERSDKFTIYKTDFEDPTLLYELLLECCELFGITIEKIIGKSMKGDWILRDSKILFSPNFGFNMITTKIPTPIISLNSELQVNEDVTTLVDNVGKKIFSIQTGLLNCHAEETKLPDFKCYGLSFINLLNCGAFNKNFDISFKPKKVVEKLLTDMDVEKPTITPQTKSKLRLSDDWKLADSDPSEMEAEVKTQEADDIMSFFIVDAEEIKDLKLNWEFDPLYEFINTFSTMDLFNTNTTTTELYFPRKTLNMIKNLKYDCISISCTLQGTLNRSTIFNIKKIIRNNKKNIIYSLISRYDRFVGSSGETSPNTTTIRFDPILLNLGLIIEEEDENLEL